MGTRFASAGVKLKRHYVFIGIIFLFNACVIRFSFAENVLRVGVVSIPPFAYQEQGVYKGIAIELWTKIAKENKWKYRYVAHDFASEKLLLLLQNHTIDVAIGGISVINKRLKMADFSRPYYVEAERVIVKNKSTSFFHTLGQITANILDYKWGLLLGVAMFVLFIYLLWWVEYGRIAEKKQKTALDDVVWNVFLTLLTKQSVGRYNTWFGRLLVSILLFISLAAGGLIIAVLASSIMVSLAPQEYSKLSDLKNKPIAVGYHSAEEQSAKEFGLMYIPYDNFYAGVDALLQDKVVGVMKSFPEAHYFLKHNNNLNLIIAPFSIAYNEVAFAFQRNSPYTKPFDLSLTALQDSREMESICKAYFGSEASALCNL